MRSNGRIILSKDIWCEGRIFIEKGALAVDCSQCGGKMELSDPECFIGISERMIPGYQGSIILMGDQHLHYEGPIVETVTAAVCIVAADAAAKSADIQLLEIRLANGLGGKSFVIMEGTVADVEASVAAGVELVRQEGLLVRQVVIPQLHEQMRAKVL